MRKFGTKRNEKSSKKQIAVSFLVLCIISVILGVMIEAGIAFVKYQKAGAYKGRQAIEQEAIQTAGVEYLDGRYYVPQGGGELIIKLDGQYIHKLEYKYISAAYFQSKLEVTTTNIYGDQVTEEIEDDARAELPRSVINVDTDADQIRIRFENDEAELAVFDFQVDNTWKLNPLRSLFWIVTLFIPLFLFWFRREYCERLEWAFAVVALALGLLLLAVQPPHCNSWDEHIHYANCNVLAKGEDIPFDVEYLYTHPESLSVTAVRSVEERIDEIHVLNNLSRSPANMEFSERNVFALINVGYVFQALAIKAGSVLGLPFYFVWLLAKFTNLALYIVVMFWAIRKTPIGKNLLCVVALAPTAMFLTSAFTYDVTVTAFITLGLAVLVKAMVEKDEVMGRGEQILFVVSMIIGSCPKAVYIPLILAGFFIPKKKFKTQKEAYLFKGILLVGFCLMMSTFVLPAVFSPPATGDSRGGSNVSTGRQLGYVLGSPIAYARVLWNNAAPSFIRYEFLSGVEAGGFVSMGYSGNITYPLLFFFFLWTVFLTDRYKQAKINVNLYALDIKDRITAGMGMVITVALIWTALYLSFTEVGNLKIAGVQGRYYQPFLWMLLIIFQTDKIKVTFSKVKYQAVVLMISSFIILEAVYKLFLTVSCL